MTRVFPIAAFVLLIAAPSSAQLCRGAPAFDVYPYQAGGTATFSEDAQAVGGEFGVGGRIPFAGAGFTVRDVEGPAGTAAEITGRAGLEVQVSTTRRIFVCPIAFLAFGTGPDVGPVDVSTFRIGGGGRVGVVVQDSPSLMVVPTFGVDGGNERISREIAGVEDDESDGFGVATVGVGFIVNRRFGITPEIGVPFSVADSDVTFSVRFVYAFGE